MRSHVRRGVSAVAVTVAVLLVTAAPASAGTSHNATLTGGTSTFAKAPNADVVLPLGPQPGCPSGTLTLGTNPHPNIEITALHLTTTVVVNGVTYVMVVTRLASDVGTAANGTVSSMGLRLQFQFYTLAPGTLCTPGALRCTLQSSAISLLELAGSHTDADSDGEPEIGDTFNVSASAVGLAVAGVCVPPFSLYHGGTVRIDILTFLLTS